MDFDLEMYDLDRNTSTDYPCVLRRKAPIYELNFYTYGYATQAICALGLVGNILNLIILTRSNMKAVCYIYMRAKAITDLIAVIFTFPWAARNLKSIKLWTDYYQAYYHSYFELYLMNSFVAAGVFLMLAITIERFISVCYPLKARTMVGSKRRAYITSFLLTILALFLFIPYAFQSQVEEIQDSNNKTLYSYCENHHVTDLISWKIYRWAQQVLCRILPVILIAGLNMSIIISFRKIVKKRQKMKGKLRNQADFREQRRLTFMLIGLSIMFIVCFLPAAVLIGLISGVHKKIYEFQIFRAVANLLEIVNYSFSFYTYCFSSSEFRNEFLKMITMKKQKYNVDCVEEDESINRSKIDQTSDNISVFTLTKASPKKNDETQETKSLELEKSWSRNKINNLTYDNHNYISIID